MSEEVGVGPHPEPWPEGDHLDPELLRDGDRRNVVDRYRYWSVEAITADLDARRHPFHVAIENWEHDARRALARLRATGTEVALAPRDAPAAPFGLAQQLLEVVVPVSWALAGCGIHTNLNHISVFFIFLCGESHQETTTGPIGRLASTSEMGRVIPGCRDHVAALWQAWRRNLAVEALRRLLQGEVNRRRGRNVVQARSFSEMLAQSILRYQTGPSVCPPR